MSVLGSSTTSVLLPLLAVMHLHAGPAWMGAITASAWLPWLIVGLPAGAWVDRLAPRTVMIAADLGSAGALLSVPVAWWLDVLDLSQLLAVAFAGGVATVFFRTAYVKLTTLVVAESQLESANARLFGTESAMQTAGPGLGAVLLATVSAAVGLLVDVVSFLVSALCLWRIGSTQQAGEDPVADDHGGAGLLTRIRDGVHLVGHDRHLRSLTMIGGVSNFGLTGYGALLVLFLTGPLELSSTTVGVVLAAGSSGGLVGATLATRLARRIGTGRASTVLFLVGGPAALLVGLPGSGLATILTVLGLGLVGAAVVGGNVVRGASRQRYVPGHLMGRVVTTSQMVNYGTMPLAGLVAGFLGAHLGVRPTVIVMASVHAVACWSILTTAIGRSKELPSAIETATFGAWSNPQPP